MFKKVIMEVPLLKDEHVYPTTEILQNVLGKSFEAYQELMNTIPKPPYTLEPVWNYYKDGKAWLCKVIFKKKTIFWLSVWDGFFKTGFYFTEKTGEGIQKLAIDPKLKESFFTAKPIGKLIPLSISMRNEEQLGDLLKLAEFKKGVK
jgi:hypothetical protein